MFFTRMRVALLENLRFTLVAWHANYSRRTRSPVTNITRMIEGQLPPGGIARFQRLLHEGHDPARVAGIFHEWMEVDEWVLTSRTPEEGHFTTEELRLDRLERLIREEWFINGARTFGGEVDREEW